MLTNLAERAETLNYTCPQLTDKVGIQITGGRHPVVEHVLTEPFIANPLTMSPQRRLLIITGPNMGGKVPICARRRLSRCSRISAVLCRQKSSYRPGGSDFHPRRSIG